MMYLPSLLYLLLVAYYEVLMMWPEPHESFGSEYEKVSSRKRGNIVNFVKKK